jgi:hypothetical protein
VGPGGFEGQTDGKRWAEKNFRRVMGHKDIWALKPILDGKPEKQLDRREKVA